MSELINKSIMIGIIIISIALIITSSKSAIIQYSTVYEDLRFPANIFKVVGSSNVPDYEQMNGTGLYAYAFSPTTVEQLFLSFQFPHERTPMSTVYPHVHWSHLTNNTGTVVWCADYSCANIGETFYNTRTGCILSNASTSKKHIMTDMLVLPSNLTSSAMCLFKIYRNATDLRDTFPDDAFFLEFDIHYLSDRRGEEWEN